MANLPFPLTGEVCIFHYLFASFAFFTRDEKAPALDTKSSFISPKINAN
jgi:hypothetical protein